MRTQRGFTLAELIIVIIIAGVLAAVAVPRFNIDNFSSRGARDFVGSALRFAQKSAVAMRRNVCVGITASQVTLTYASAAGNNQACAAGNVLVNPGNGRPFGDVSNALPLAGQVTTPTPINFIFDSLGQPLTAPATLANAAITVMVNGNATPITIEPGSGAVR